MSVAMRALVIVSCSGPPPKDAPEAGILFCATQTRKMYPGQQLHGMRYRCEAGKLHPKRLRNLQWAGNPALTRPGQNETPAYTLSLCLIKMHATTLYRAVSSVIVKWTEKEIAPVRVTPQTLAHSLDFIYAAPHYPRHRTAHIRAPRALRRFFAVTSKSGHSALSVWARYK